MVNLSFFPSRRLAFYMVRLFLTRSVAVLFALVLILMTLDLLGESGKILAVPGNGDAELWRYVGLRIPLLVARFSFILTTPNVLIKKCNYPFITVMYEFPFSFAIITNADLN